MKQVRKKTPRASQSRLGYPHRDRVDHLIDFDSVCSPFGDVLRINVDMKIPTVPLAANGQGIKLFVHSSTFYLWFRRNTQLTAYRASRSLLSNDWVEEFWFSFTWIIFAILVDSAFPLFLYTGIAPSRCSYCLFVYCRLIHQRTNKRNVLINRIGFFANKGVQAHEVAFRAAEDS